VHYAIKDNFFDIKLTECICIEYESVQTAVDPEKSPMCLSSLSNHVFFDPLGKQIRDVAQFAYITLLKTMILTSRSSDIFN